MAWASPSQSDLRARPSPRTARASGPGPLRAGRRFVEEPDREREAVFGGAFGAALRLERVGGRVDAGFLAEEEPEVRGGALDRLAMSREYP